MNPRTFLPAFAIVVALLFGTQLARSQGATFTYQGQLVSGGNPADGNYDLTFSLFNANTGGSQVGVTLTNLDVGVTNGLFTTTLNFGTGAFSGIPLWLGLGVRSNGTDVTFSPLSPRRPHTRALRNYRHHRPDCQQPQRLASALTATGGTVVTNGSSSVNLSGTFTGNGAGLTNLFIPQLGTNVALLNTNQTFSGTNIFSGSNYFTGAVVLTNLTNMFAGNGGGLTNVPSPTENYFLYVYDTTGQTLATADTFQDITFNTDSANSGWGYSAAGSMFAEQTGLYLFQYTIVGYNPSTSIAVDFEVRAVNLTTSTVLPGSQTFITIPQAGYYYGTLAKSFIAPVTAGQTIALQFTASASSPSASVQANNLFGDTFPGASLTIVRIQ